MPPSPINVDKPTIFDLLAKEALSELTISQLNSAASVSNVDMETLEFWAGIEKCAQIVKESRTYGHGLPIPELSSIKSMAIDDGASDTLKPSAPGIYEVVGIQASTAVSIGVTDGSAITYVHNLGSAGMYEPTHALYLTDTLYLIVANNSGGASNVTVAYHQVGL